MSGDGSKKTLSECANEKSHDSKQNTKSISMVIDALGFNMNNIGFDQYMLRITFLIILLISIMMVLYLKIIQINIYTMVSFGLTDNTRISLSMSLNNNIYGGYVPNNIYNDQHGGTNTNRSMIKSIF